MTAVVKLSVAELQRLQRLATELTVARNQLGNAVGAIIDAGGYCTGPEDVVAAIGRLAADRDALRTAMARHDAITPATVAHLEELKMDTPEDQAVVDSLLAVWREVRGDQ